MAMHQNSIMHNKNLEKAKACLDYPESPSRTNVTASSSRSVLQSLDEKEYADFIMHYRDLPVLMRSQPWALLL
ncbi:hypothetical protein FRC09_012800 [Ceratobasidium sp. 395]|nr:hypothetical protein FRC09_012800 [Ceratobasidium sp. 395]